MNSVNFLFFTIIKLCKRINRYLLFVIYHQEDVLFLVQSRRSPPPILAEHDDCNKSGKNYLTLTDECLKIRNKN